MFFSVIIPVYNAEKTIERCLRSVRQQSFTDFEALMIDDGSADGSGGICRACAAQDSRFRYIRQENSGVSATRNRGMREARGEFLTFLDSDDWYADTFLEEIREAIRSNPDDSHFWCGYEEVSDDSGAPGTVRKAGDGAETTTDRSEVMTLYDRFLLAPVWNKAFRRDVIAANSLRMPEDLSLGEDLLFNFAYLEACGSTTIHVLDRGLYKYRVDSAESLNKKYRPDLLEIYERLSSEMGGHLKDWELAPDQMSRYYSAVFSMLFRGMKNTMCGRNEEERGAKLRKNNEVLRGELFRKAVKNADCHIHPLYRLAAALADYRLVLMTDSLAGFKRQLRKRAEQK